MWNEIPPRILLDEIVYFHLNEMNEIAREKSSWWMIFHTAWPIRTYPIKAKIFLLLTRKDCIVARRRTRRFRSISSFLTIASSTVLLPFILYHIQAISMCFTSESTCLLSKRAARSRSNVYYPVLLAFLFFLFFFFFIRPSKITFSFSLNP